MFEHRTKPLLSRREFFARWAKSAAAGVVVIVFALGLGMVGYHHFETMSWLDAFENASMILSGMGQVATLMTDGGKFFAGCYALFSGLALLTIAGLFFAPVVHRFLHRFHLEDEADEEPEKKI
jgi:hypothetical protein